MNVLIVKLSSLGDVIQTMPVVADVLSVYPEAKIDWIVEESFAPLVARVQGVRHVIPIALRRWRKTWFSRTTQHERRAFKKILHATTYDVIIDCQGLIKSALVARMASLASGGLRGSFANKSEACSYEWPVKFLLRNNQAMPARIHAVARTRLLASKLLGYVPQGAPKTVFKDLPPRDPAGHTIMLTHGTTRLDNEWPRHQWEDLSALLTEHQSHRILLPQSNARELDLCQSVKARIPRDAEILPRMGLPELLDVMATCHGVIGVDSGLSHLAVALNLPHVQIFSQDRAWRAGPVGSSHQVALGGTYTPSVEDVQQAWMKVETAR
jgi:heptosyltransferase I